MTLGISVEWYEIPVNSIRVKSSTSCVCSTLLPRVISKSIDNLSPISIVLVVRRSNGIHGIEIDRSTSQAHVLSRLAAINEMPDGCAFPPTLRSRKSAWMSNGIHGMSRSRLTENAISQQSCVNRWMLKSIFGCCESESPMQSAAGGDEPSVMECVTLNVKQWQSSGGDMSGGRISGIWRTIVAVVKSGIVQSANGGNGKSSGLISNE